MHRRTSLIFCLTLFLCACSAGNRAIITKNEPLEDPFDRITRTFLANKNKFSGKKIVVYEFTDLTGRVKPEGRLAAERLTTRLVQTGQFEMIERSRLETVLKELKLSESGTLDEKSVVHSGKILGAGAAVTGTIAQIKGEFELNARVIDIENGTILTGSAARIDEDSLLVKSEGIQFQQPPQQLRTEDFRPARPIQPQTIQPPRGWVAWPGWNNSYGSFTVNSGRIYYHLSGRQHDHAWADSPFNGYYPGLLLARGLKGNNWSVDIKVNYQMPLTSGRWFSACIWEGKDGIRPSIGNKDQELGLCVFREADAGYNADQLALRRCRNTADWINTKVLNKNINYFRFLGEGNLVRLQYSSDGEKYLDGLTADVSEAHKGKTQTFVLGGQSFSDSSSYAEYEYIRVNGRDVIN